MSVAGGDSAKDKNAIICGQVTPATAPTRRRDLRPGRAFCDSLGDTFKRHIAGHLDGRIICTYERK